MRTKSRIPVLGAVMSGVLVSALFIGSAGAMGRSTIVGSGTLSCRAAGRVTFSPPLAAGGTATSETITLRANLVGCSGTGDGATVSGGRSLGSVTVGTNDCSSLTAISSATVSGAVKWKTTMGSPKLEDSVLTFTSGTAGVNAIGKPTVSLAGSSTAGSFSGAAASVNAVISQSLTAIGKACLHGTLKGITINASASTASLG